MNKQHFLAFAAEAAKLRQTARQHEATTEQHKAVGNKAEAAASQTDAENCYLMALGIETATITVAQQFNPRFDVARFRQACCKS